MADNASQLALISALLMNWDGIRLRMEPLSPALAAQLSEISSRLLKADSPVEVEDILDDLLTLTRGTAAYTYVQDLVRRSAVSGGAVWREPPLAPPRVLEVETPLVLPPAPPPPPANIAAMNGSRMLGTLISMEAEIARVPIFFATNRARTSQPSAPYGGEPSQEIFYGVAPVTIPVDKHKTGEVESPHWWSLFPKVNRERRFVTLEGLEPLSQAEFATRMASLLASASATDLLIFLHGFNVTFEEGALRAAQIAYDMKFPGAVVLFSWPSAGSAMAYSNDEDRAAASADRFAAFLKSLEGGPWKRVHVMAHSMGNRVMLLGLADNARPKLTLGQVVFAAADVYVPLFEDKFPKLQAAGRLSSTSYASDCDVALRLSSMLHRGARVGLISGLPFTIHGLDTIDASAVDTGFLGHGYFSGERSVISDLRLLIYKSLPPFDRGLTAAKGYWLFPR